MTDAEDDVVEIRPAGTDAATSIVPSLLFIKVPEAKTVKNRLHLDVNATDTDQRHRAGPAARPRAPPRSTSARATSSWYVLADPEGNEFCLLRDRVDAF